MLAAWTTTLSKKPSVSTKIWRLTPTSFVFPSKPRTPPMRVLTDWKRDNGGARGGIAAGMQPGQLAQVGVDLDPGPIAAPSPKVIRDRLPSAVLAGQIPPGTAGPQDVEHAIGDAPHIRRARAAIGFAGG